MFVSFPFSFSFSFLSFFFFFLFFFASFLRRSTHLNRVVNCEKVRPYYIYFFLVSQLRFFSFSNPLFLLPISVRSKIENSHCFIDSNTRFLNSSLKLRSTMTWRNMVVKYTLCIHRKQYAAERCSVFEEM